MTNPRDKISTCDDRWSLQTAGESETGIIESYLNEHIYIGGATSHVFKLLGVHEQGTLIDLAKNGTPISSGNRGIFEVKNVFVANTTPWRSKEAGNDLLIRGYIGYDFGEVKLDNGRIRYSQDAWIRHNISTIMIQQGDNANNRVIKARIERSEDGIKWYGSAIVDLPNDNKVNKISFKQTVQSRFWRVRPTVFAGGLADYWEVKTLELLDYDVTDISDIQDQIWQENRDREYATTPVNVKCQYDLLEILSDFSKWAMPDQSTQSYYMQYGFASVVEALGRPFVIGDIIELPPETQYSFDLKPIKKYLEVTDVTWSAEGYTPGYVPLILKVVAQPLIATQENSDLFQIYNKEDSITGLVDYDAYDTDMEGVTDNENHVWQDELQVSQEIKARSLTENPDVMITDIADNKVYNKEQIAAAKEHINLEKLNPKAVHPDMYTNDAMPPNGLKYTEGDTLPSISKSQDGAYHRLTYKDKKAGIPTRLFKFSGKKNRWIFMEADETIQTNPQKHAMSKYFQDRYNPQSNEDV
jgi:hypothetical protein